MNTVKITKDQIIKAFIINSAFGVKVNINPKALYQVDSTKEPLTLISVDKIHYQVTVGDELSQISGCRIFDLKGNLTCKMYLRSMSTMTVDEKKEYEALCNNCLEGGYADYNIQTLDDSQVRFVTDWLYEHHFDSQGWIKLGLAEEAPISLYTE